MRQVLNLSTLHLSNQKVSSYNFLIGTSDMVSTPPHKATSILPILMNAIACTMARFDDIQASVAVEHGMPDGSPAVAAASWAIFAVLTSWIVEPITRGQNGEYRPRRSLEQLYFMILINSKICHFCS